MSKFEQDLSNEQILSIYLDEVYKIKGYDIQRVYDLNEQHQGIDLKYKKNGVQYLIDEKAQLHYLNKNLPTFTFELSYLNEKGNLKEGWLFDPSKKTDTYFLVTAIMLKGTRKLLKQPDDIASLKITAVSRKKMIGLMQAKGLSQAQLNNYDKNLRHNAQFGRNKIKELDSKREGLIYYTEHLQEKPMNLQLRLDYLIREKVGKNILF